MSRRTRGCAAGALAACVLLSLPALAAPSNLGSGGLGMGPHGDPTGLVPQEPPAPNMGPHGDPTGLRLLLLLVPTNMGPYGAPTW